MIVNVSNITSGVCVGSQSIITHINVMHSVVHYINNSHEKYELIDGVALVLADGRIYNVKNK